jgi:hypothetical protein
MKSSRQTTKWKNKVGICDSNPHQFQNAKEIPEKNTDSAVNNRKSVISILIDQSNSLEEFSQNADLQSDLNLSNKAQIYQKLTENGDQPKIGISKNSKFQAGIDLMTTGSPATVIDHCTTQFTENDRQRLNRGSSITRATANSTLGSQPMQNACRTNENESQTQKCCDCNGRNAVCKNCKCVKANTICSNCYPSRNGRCTNIANSNLSKQSIEENNSISANQNFFNDSFQNPSHITDRTSHGGDNTKDILDTIMMHRRPVLKNIPKGARGTCVSAFNQVLSNIVHNPQDHTLWLKYFLFSFECLQKPARGNKTSLSSFVIKNVESFKQKFDFSQTFTSKQKKRKKENDQTRFLKNQVCEKIDLGDIRGAMRTLLAEDTIAADDEDTFASLIDKHPARFQNARPFEQTGPSMQHVPIISEELLLGCLKSFPPDSSGGIDGLRPQHLKDMFLSAADASSHTLVLSTWLEFCNMIFSGNLPQPIRPLFFGARLLALKKKDGGIRPIAVGNSTRRLVSKIACHLIKQKITPYLAPHQTGFGIKLGAEAAIHATRSFIEENTTKAVLKIDFKNAFNCVRRDVFLQEVQTLCPEIFNYISSSYSTDSILSFNEKTISSQEGAQQGDPIGPLLFCLAIQPIIRKISCKLNIWYLDDGTIGDSLEEVLLNFSMIIKESKSIGLEVNINKCELALGDMCPKNDIEWEGIKVLKREEFFLLGSSLNHESTNNLIQNKCQDLRNIFGKLSLLPSHYALHILKNCYSTPKLIYLLRTAACFQNNMLKEMDLVIQNATSEFGNIKFTESALEQATLPCRFGGIGIRKASELAVPAYLSSVTAAKPLTSVLYPSTSINPYFEEGLQLWRNATSKEWPTEPTRQRSWDEELSRVKVNQILNNETDMYSQKRLQSLQNKNASDWLNAVPSKNMGTFLNDQEIQTALCLRLGLSYSEEHPCKCGLVTDRMGKHCFSCKKNSGKILRHNMVNSLISKNLQAMGMPNSLEPSNLFKANGLRPDGISRLPFKYGKSLIWDFTCPHPLCQSHLQQSHVTASAESKKTEKYAVMTENYHFIPIAIDTLGGYGPQATKFVNFMGRCLSEKYNDPRRLSFLKQSIGIAIQKGNAQTMLFSVY